MRYKNKEKKVRVRRRHVRPVIFGAAALILAAVIFFCVSSYIEYDKFKTYSERARNIYVAAQSSLDNMSDEAFFAFSKALSDIAGENEAGTVYFQVKGASDSDGAAIFSQLTDGYIYNSDILNDAVGIELNLNERTVTAVACADGGVMLTREGTDGRNHVNFKNKDSAHRKSACIGYFDGAMLAAEESYVPKIGTVSIENGDVLEIVFSLKADERMRIGQSAYEITVQDSDDDTIMTMMFNEDVSGHLLPANDVSDEKTVSVLCKFFGQGVPDTEEMMVFPAYIDSDYRAHIVLDAIDTGAVSVTGTSSDEVQAAYMESYSAMRFVTKTGISAAENISAGVRAADAPSDDITYSNSESLLMESANEGHFTIANGRHLFNIRFIEAGGRGGFTYEQTDSFAWGNSDFGIVGAGHVFKNMKKQNTANFIPIDRLKAESVLTASGDSVIEGLTLSNTMRQDRFGLFRENNGTIENITVSGLSVESSNNYTGGLCGVNNGVVQGCTVTAAEISGGIYTGGIAGYQSGGQIEASVFGGSVSAWGYGGGITGASLYNGRISDCTVTAAVYAREGYSGGVTGYNEGVVEDSTFSVDLQSENGVLLLEIIAKKGGSGDYTGGIVGYNAGRLISEDEITVTPAVFGRNYTGGITGYNAPGAFIGNYVLDGGYIKGRACVGGLVGFNGSALFFGDEKRQSKPGNIYGDYYVGGLIGANVVAAHDESLNLLASVDSESGMITATGNCIGGVIGYNVLIDSAQNTADDNGQHTDTGTSQNADTKETVFTSPETAAAYLTAVTYDEFGSRALPAVVSEKLSAAGADTAYAGLKITADGPVRLEKVSGALYVGGVIGMQQEDSALNISGVTSEMSVCAVETVYESGAHFAYAGAIMGRVPALTMLYECAAGENARVVHDGSYIGLLTEVNEGRIERCESPGMTMEERDGAGGIAGLNAAAGEGFLGGVIADCTLTGTLFAGKMTGGIVSVNRGEIYGCTISADVTSSGDTAGGIAAVNEGTIGALELEDGDSTEPCKIEADISGGDNVGAAAGINRGAVSGCEIGSKGLLDSRRTITGKNNVGGFVGLQKDSGDIVSEGLRLPSYVDVYGDSYVGGIAGNVTGRAVYSNCESSGSIFASSDMAGGIAGSVSQGAALRACTVKDVVITAPEADYIGGITGFNAGEIDSCSVLGDTNLTGTWRVGGIAGENTGNIKVSSVAQIYLILKENTQGSCVGGIAGENTGNIENSTAQQSTKTEKNNEIHIQSWVDKSFLGGIAGKNSGKIISTNAAVKINTGALLSLVNDAGGTAGGIAGENTGDIRYYRFTGQIENSGRGSAFIGGIAGVNGGDGGEQALIESCYVSDRALNERALTDENKADNGKSQTLLAANSVSMLGGIVGINYKNATVEASVPVKCYITAEGGVLGGVAGYNSGTLKDCKANKTNGDESVKVRVKLYASVPASIGGIAGKSSAGASVQGCMTGNDWYYGQS